MATRRCAQRLAQIPPAPFGKGGQGGFYIFFLLFLLFLTACQTQPRFTVEPLPRYDAMFQRTCGWIGGDGAYTTALNDNRFLWLFGDTFVGDVKDGRRVDSRLINNSMAIQTGKEPQSASIEFIYRRLSDGLPEAMVKPQDAIGWLWPFHGVRTADGLFLFLLQVERTDNRSTFGFRLVSTWLGHVGNPDDPPERWVMSQRKIPWGNERRLFGSSVLCRNGRCYIYGTLEESDGGLVRKNMILARVPEGRIGDFNAWRFYAGGEWVSEADRAGRICENVASEFSVSFQPALQRYVLVYTEGGLSENIVIRFASEPHGPWGSPMRVYRCPEMGWDSRIFCYAAKGHPEISASPSELIVTYMANSMDFALLEYDARLYRPRFLRLSFSESLWP